jgi:hypothetical protein
MKASAVAVGENTLERRKLRRGSAAFGSSLTRTRERTCGLLKPLEADPTGQRALGACSGWLASTGIERQEGHDQPRGVRLLARGNL